MRVTDPPFYHISHFNATAGFCRQLAHRPMNLRVLIFYSLVGLVSVAILVSLVSLIILASLVWIVLLVIPVGLGRLVRPGSRVAPGILVIVVSLSIHVSLICLWLELGMA